MFYIRFKKNYWKNERIAHFLFFGERCEWIAQVAHQKWAMWANCSGRSPKMSHHKAIRSHRSEEMSTRERIAQVAHQKWENEWIARFLRIAHSLIFGQKRAIHSENRWANSQPCFLVQRLKKKCIAQWKPGTDLQYCIILQTSVVFVSV